MSVEITIAEFIVFDAETEKEELAVDSLNIDWRQVSG